MSKIEPAVLGFLIADELGEVMLMRYGRVREPGDDVQWDFIPHTLLDGLGGYAHMLKTYEGYERGSLVLGRENTPPPYRVRWRAVKDALAREKLSPTRPAVPWKRYERSAMSGIPRAVGWAMLDEEESKLLARRTTTSMNSRLMWAFDRAASVLLDGPHPPRLWLMPVNMRGASKAADAMTNPVCAIPVQFDEKASPEEVHAEIKEKFDSGAHWGTWYLGMMRHSLGPSVLRAAMRDYYARPRHAWMGTFSNLGDWTVPGRSARWYYLGVPPVTITNPLTGAVMGWGGRLTLTLQAHSAICIDPAVTMAMAAEWKRLALEAAAST
jgi:hypothetical protein